MSDPNLPDDGRDDDFDDENDHVHVECTHPWWDLDFLPEDDGIGCSLCGQTWESEELLEAVVVVWNSAKYALNTQGERIEALEDLVGSALSMSRCMLCGRWGGTDEWVDFGDSHQTCPDHVGDFVELGEHPEMLDAAKEWVTGRGVLTDSTTLGRWQWERNAMASKTLSDLVGDGDDGAALEREVHLTKEMSRTLGIPALVPVKVVAATVAQKLDLDPPSARISAAFMLGLVAESERQLHRWRKDHGNAIPVREQIEVIADTVSDEIAPRHPDLRAMIIVDLYGKDFSDDLEFDVEMSDGLLDMLGHRGADILITALCTKPEPKRRAKQA
jgi:hypothetical protein